jgi:hypothetical protein
MMKPEHERLQGIIKDTLRLLIKNGVNYSTQLSIQGLLAVSLDQQEMFVIQIDERLGEGEDVCHACGQSKVINSLLPNSSSRTRTRSWSESNCHAANDDDNFDDPAPAKVPRVMSQQDPVPQPSPPSAPTVTAADKKAPPQTIIIKRERGDYKLHEDWMQCPENFTKSSYAANDLKSNSSSSSSKSPVSSQCHPSSSYLLLYILSTASKI